MVLVALLFYNPSIKIEIFHNHPIPGTSVNAEWSLLKPFKQTVIQTPIYFLFIFECIFQFNRYSGHPLIKGILIFAILLFSEISNLIFQIYN